MRLRHSQELGSGRADEVVAAIADELGMATIAPPGSGEAETEEEAEPGRPPSLRSGGRFSRSFDRFANASGFRRSSRSEYLGRRLDCRPVAPDGNRCSLARPVSRLTRGGSRRKLALRAPACPGAYSCHAPWADAPSTLPRTHVRSHRDRAARHLRLSVRPHPRDRAGPRHGRRRGRLRQASWPSSASAPALPSAAARAAPATSKRSSATPRPSRRPSSAMSVSRSTR